MISEAADDTVVGDLVAVDWWDARFALDDPEVSPVLLRTMGRIAATTKNLVRLAGEFSVEPDEDVERAFTAIPREWIVAIRRIELLTE